MSIWSLEKVRLSANNSTIIALPFPLMEAK